jgi:hypothetical protein
LLALQQTGIATTNVELKHLKSLVAEMKQDVVMKVLNTSIELSEMKKGVSNIAKTNVELVSSVSSMKEEVTKVANVNAKLVHTISKMTRVSHSMTKMQDQLLALHQTGIPTTNVELKHLEVQLWG